MGDRWLVLTSCTEMGKSGIFIDLSFVAHGPHAHTQVQTNTHTHGYISHRKVNFVLYTFLSVVTFLFFPIWLCCNSVSYRKFRRIFFSFFFAFCIVTDFFFLFSNVILYLFLIRTFDAFSTFAFSHIYVSFSLVFALFFVLFTHFSVSILHFLIFLSHCFRPHAHT